MGKYSVVGQTSSELVNREGVVYHIHADLLQWNDGSRQWYGYCIVNNQWHSSIGYFESVPELWKYAEDSLNATNDLNSLLPADETPSTVEEQELSDQLQESGSGNPTSVEGIEK